MPRRWRKPGPASQSRRRRDGTIGTLAPLRPKGRCPVRMTEHFVDLQGPGSFGRFARPEAVGLVLSRIKPAVRESVRMRVLGSSRRVGRPLRELSAAWDIRYGGQTRGPDDSTRLVFRAPSLRRAAPRVFEQGVLFDDRPADD